MFLPCLAKLLGQILFRLDVTILGFYHMTDCACIPVPGRPVLVGASTGVCSCYGLACFCRTTAYMYRVMGSDHPSPSIRCGHVAQSADAYWAGEQKVSSGMRISSSRGFQPVRRWDDICMIMVLLRLRRWVDDNEVAEYFSGF